MLCRSYVPTGSCHLSGRTAANVLRSEQTIYYTAAAVHSAPASQMLVLSCQSRLTVAQMHLNVHSDPVDYAAACVLCQSRLIVIQLQLLYTLTLLASCLCTLVRAD